MTDWPASILNPLELITPWALESIGPGLTAISATGRLLQAASATYPAANTAYFYPFSLSVPCLITKLFGYNGATVSGNLDLGIYTEDGLRLLSTGSVAQSGINTLQVIDTTDIQLVGPAVFYLAIALDNTTGTIVRSNASAALPQFLALLGVAQMAAAFPLPATAVLQPLTTDTVLGVGAALRVLV